MSKPEDDVNSWYTSDENKLCNICRHNKWTHQLMIGEYRYNLRDFYMDSDLFLNLCGDCKTIIIRDIKNKEKG